MIRAETGGRLRFAALDEFSEAQAFCGRGHSPFGDSKRPPRVGRGGSCGRGKLDIATAGGTFRLTGRADRIERRADGTYTIVDFKTGAPPSGKQVRIGLAPQLTLEAAMLRRGGFAGIEPGPVAEIVYVRLSGGEPPGKECILDLKGISADALAGTALAKLATLIERFDDDAMPYRSLLLSMWSDRYGAYDELARVGEWSLAGGIDEPEMPGAQP